MSDQQAKWKTWYDADNRAAQVWADRAASAQEKAAARWEAECARHQWSNAVDVERAA